MHPYFVVLHHHKNSKLKVCSTDFTITRAQMSMVVNHDSLINHIKSAENEVVV